MHERSEVMRFQRKFLAWCLYPITPPHAARFGGKGLLFFPRAQVFDDAVGIHQVEALVLKRQPCAITDHRGLVRLQEKNLVFVDGLNVEDGYLGFNWHPLPRAWQAANVE